VVLALATGGVLLALLLLVFGYEARWAAAATLLALAAGALMKLLYWSAIDIAPRVYSAESATGLGRFGTVRPLDPPHTQPNYVMREMGYRVARKHVHKLRWIAALLLFAVPIMASLLLLFDWPGAVLIAMAALSAISAAAGVLTERWLFFAEAEHVAMVYYRGGAV
jgi:DMSO reductase anchor subunit